MMVITFIFCTFAQLVVSQMPLPFTRQLVLQDPPMTGSDVTIFQNLVIRDSAVVDGGKSGVYDETAATATSKFQQAHKLNSTGILDEDTASLLLFIHSNDGKCSIKVLYHHRFKLYLNSFLLKGVRDTGFTAASRGYLFKIFIPVYSNRSIESSATLYDAYNNILMTFPARTHGHSESDFDPSGYPDVGLNQFSTNGNTVTGLVEVDLNSPEPDPAIYGPWPVNRIVRGLEGNAAFMLPNIRDGQLIHTGNWYDQGWIPSKPMPNSAGCVHSHPEHIERIYKALVSIGVSVNENTFSGKDYPYKPQGIAVIQSIN
jgi:hypothetical protein